MTVYIACKMLIGDMMFIGRKIDELVIIAIFCFLWSFCTLISLSGCSSNIPPASSLESGKVTLSWDEVPGAVSYNVHGSRSPGRTIRQSTKFRNVTNPFTVTKLQPGKTYYFVVTVVTSSGEIKESKEKSYKAIANTVGNIHFGDIVSHSERDAEGSVTLAWDDVPNASYYNIYLSDRPGVTTENGTKIFNVQNPHKIEYLKKGHKYYFIVTAVNAAGESKGSEEVSFIVGQ